MAGLGAIAVIALLFAYGTWGRALSEIGGYMVSAEYARVDGVVPGSEVRLAGVKVGEVVDLRLQSETRRPVVDMRIEDGIRIPVDSVAAILSDGLFSAKFIRIDPGFEEKILGEQDRFRYGQDSIDLIRIFEKIVLTAEGSAGEQRQR